MPAALTCCTARAEQLLTSGEPRPSSHAAWASRLQARLLLSPMTLVLALLLVVWAGSALRQRAQDTWQQ